VLCCALAGLAFYLLDPPTGEESQTFSLLPLILCPVVHREKGAGGGAHIGIELVLIGWLMIHYLPWFACFVFGRGMHGWAAHDNICLFLAIASYTSNREK